MSVQQQAVDATGTRRRLQALHWLGWTTKQLAILTGTPPKELRATALGAATTIPPATAARVRTTYSAIWNHPPPTTTATDLQRRDAARSGWAPPMAWDNIDDPREKPRGTRKPVTAADPLDDILRLLRAGETPTEVARRVGVKPASLARRLRRAGHHNWAAHCERRPHTTTRRT